MEGSPAIVEPQNAWMLAIGMIATQFLQLILGVHYENMINRMSFRLCARLRVSLRRLPFCTDTSMYIDSLPGTVDALSSELCSARAPTCQSAPSPHTLRGRS